jgi:DNA-binding SARP family transcriptional activator
MDRANVIASEADPSNTGWDDGEVRRNRLLERLHSSRGLVLIQAPTGFGKTLLARQLTGDSRWPRRMLVSGNESSAEPQLEDARSSPPDLLVVDDATPAAVDAAASLAATSHDILVVCLGRSLSITPAVRAQRPIRLTHLDLRFDLQETHRLLTAHVGEAASDQVAYVLHTVTDGWPEHIERVVQAMAGRGSSMDSVRSLASRGAHLDPLVDRCLDSLDSSMIDATTQLAHLGRFSEQTANALVPSLVERATSGGFPLLENSLGELVIPELLANRLTQLAPPDAAVARTLIPVMVGTLGLHSTTRALLSAGAFDDAASLLCSLPEHHLDRSNQTELIGMIRAIERQTSDYPGLAFRRARVHRNLAQIADQIGALEQARASGRRLGDEKVVHAAEVELFALEVQSSEADEHFATRLRHLQDTAPSLADRQTMIRLREAEAFLLCINGHPPDLHRSLEVFREVAAEWEMVGDQMQSASVIRRMAAGPMMHLGRFSEAANLVARLEQFSDSPLGMASTAQTRLRNLVLAGRVREAESLVRHAKGAVEAVGVSWLTALIHWSRVHLGMFHGDLSEAEDGFAEATSNLGELLHTPTGTIFHSECASAFACLGATDLARDTLSRCDNDDDLSSRLEWRTAEIVVEARVGDAHVAETRALELLNDPEFPPDRVWRVQIERLISASRSGVEMEDEERIRQQIESSAVRLGVPDFASFLMGPLLETPPTDAGDTGDPATVITLLGEFSLRREERTLDVPSGNVARLLKLLAIADEARSIDYVIDQLWPDTTSDIGRRRLKNVLTRIRKVSETLVERSPETLQLGAAVGSDLRLFRDAAHRAIAGAAPHRLSLCVEALNLYTGPLLPTDQYDDEISIERVQVDALAASVFELLLNSMEIGRLSPAWVLETANRIAIESDQVYVRIAEMAVDSGAEVCATSALARAAAIADSLDVPLLTDSRLEHLLPKT